MEFEQIYYAARERTITKRILYTAHFSFSFHQGVLPTAVLAKNPLGLVIHYFKEDAAIGRRAAGTSRHGCPRRSSPPSSFSWRSCSGWRTWHARSSPTRRSSGRTTGPFLTVYVAVLALNTFAALLLLVRALGLKRAGRKLAHLDHELRTRLRDRGRARPARGPLPATTPRPCPGARTAAPTAGTLRSPAPSGDLARSRTRPRETPPGSADPPQEARRDARGELPRSHPLQAPEEAHRGPAGRPGPHRKPARPRRVLRQGALGHLPAHPEPPRAPLRFRPRQGARPRRGAPSSPRRGSLPKGALERGPCRYDGRAGSLRLTGAPGRGPRRHRPLPRRPHGRRPSHVFGGDAAACQGPARRAPRGRPRPGGPRTLPHPLARRPDARRLPADRSPPAGLRRGQAPARAASTTRPSTTPTSTPGAASKPTGTASPSSASTTR